MRHRDARTDGQGAHIQMRGLGERVGMTTPPNINTVAYW